MALEDLWVALEDPWADLEDPWADLVTWEAWEVQEAWDLVEWDLEEWEVQTWVDLEAPWAKA